MNGRNILRIGIGMAIVLSALTAGTAEAICQNGGKDNYRRLVVAQSADIFFTAGQPATRFINDVFVTYNAVGASPIYNDCGAGASSTIPGVSVQGNYCPWNSGTCVIAPSGTWAAVDKSQPDAGSPPPGTYRYYEQDHLRPIAVIYDGTSPAGTIGRVDIATTDEWGNPVVIIGRVNVFIVAGAPAPTWFIVTSTAQTIVGSTLTLDSPYLNGRPDARLFAMHFRTSGNWNHPIAVVYDGLTRRWQIRNEDAVKMLPGLSFSVRIDPSAARINTAQWKQDHYLIIDDPVANENPFATIMVTAVGSASQSMRSPFAVAYVAPHWQILFTDGALMPVSTQREATGFFVKILGSSQYVDDTFPTDPSGFQSTHLANGAGVDLVGVGAARASGDTKYLRNFCWATTAFTPIITTLNWTALPPPAPVNYNWIESKLYGVSFVGNTATVFHEDGSTMYGGTPFNVWAPYRPGCSPR